MSTTIAQTILTQLGGNRFLAMAGAKQLVDLGNGLQFAIGRGATITERGTFDTHF